MTDPLEHDAIRSQVRNRYAGIAAGNGGCCSPNNGSCCGSSDPLGNPDASAKLGYSEEERNAVPDGSNLGLGCGNPQAIADMKMGETVVDLGSGAGFDCFLAARQVGESGRVIGVDMTPEMLGKSRENARKGGYGNVEFRLGEIEHLPIADNTADVIISNCVINLSPYKRQVFKEAFRVLKSGGRLAISDVVATRPISEQIKANMAAYCGCIGGAVPAAEVEALLSDAGFTAIRIRIHEASREFIKEWFPGSGVENDVVSATIEAIK
jgi:SAM-dependent methyltransferase